MIKGPRNNFPLHDAPAYLFVAGGIGITPFLPMMRQLQAQGRPWRLLYRGRSIQHMAFGQDLHHRYQDRVMLMPSDTTDRPDLHELLRNAPQGCAVYCCGPDTLMDELAEAVHTSGAHTTLYRERFTPSNRAADAVDEPFTVELNRSGRRIDVAADETMLEAMREAASAAPASCENGVCGSCELSVLSGVPEHRDDVLDDHERDRTDVIHPCISRSKSPVIVVDA
jgi:ferredoxin-NADP reductase